MMPVVNAGVPTSVTRSPFTSSSSGTGIGNPHRTADPVSVKYSVGLTRWWTNVSPPLAFGRSRFRTGGEHEVRDPARRVEGRGLRLPVVVLRAERGPEPALLQDLREPHPGDGVVHRDDELARTVGVRLLHEEAHRDDPVAPQALARV